MSNLKGHLGCASTLRIERLRCGELSDARLEAHIAGCAACGARREQLASAERAFLAELPSWQALQTVVQRQRRRQRLARRSAVAGGALSLAAALALTVWAPGVAPPSRATPTSEGTRSKGAVKIGFFVKRGHTVQLGASGATVFPGDRLRFTYSSPRDRYLALFNRDTRKASTYYPQSQHAALARAGTEVALGFGVELDDYIGEEDVYAVFCDEPFAIEPLRAELQARRELPPPPGCSVDRIRLVKEPAP